jgi:hypothetical protein
LLAQVNREHASGNDPQAAAAISVLVDWQR